MMITCIELLLQYAFNLIPNQRRTECNNPFKQSAFLKYAFNSLVSSSIRVQHLIRFNLEHTTKGWVVFPETSL